MKVLIVRTFPDIMNINSYNVQEIGLAKALVMRGDICDIVLYNGREPDREELFFFQDKPNGKKYQIKIYWLKGYNFVKNGFFPSLHKILSDYDVIQVDEYDLIYSWMLYTKQQKPTVIYHGLYKSNYSRGYNLKCAIFDRIFLPHRKYEKVIALTKSYMAADFLRDKGFRNVYPVGVGIDPENFQFNQKIGKTNNLLPPKIKKRLLYIGKIEERRNSLWLIDLLDAILDEQIEVELVIIGMGEGKYYQKFMDRITPLEKQGHIIYMKNANQQEMREIYPFCDLFLFPSNYEIFGMVLLEAMYFGVPVVSSVNGGSSMLIKDNVNGKIVKEFSIQMWKIAVIDLMKDDAKREKMGKRAKDEIEKHFLWTELCDKFRMAYKKAIDEFNGEKGC